MEQEKIYELKLHESLTFQDSNGWHNDVIRVAGGWIYIQATSDKMTSCFVPFDNEFMKYNNNVPF